MRHLDGRVLAGLALAAFLGSAVFAQDAVYPTPSFTPDQLDQLVSPIALYPDPLVAEITAAATFPDQIVVADRDLANGMSADDLSQQGLDPSVEDLAHYPNLLKWLDDNLQWTTQLGQAFIAQQSDVMDAVQRMRAKAQSLGNLPSTPQETVTSDDGDIEIEPTDPDEIYIPQYNPDAIYYDPGIFATFGIGLPVGLWWNHDWDWHHHNVIYWDPGHPRPHDWWTRPPIQRHDIPGAHVWRAPAGRVVAYTGDRGYVRPTTPTRPAPHVEPFRPSPAPQRPRPDPVVGQRAPNTHLPAPREPAPPVERLNPAPAPAPERAGGYNGMFGGGESPRSTETFSSRGAESRGVSTPVSGGFHGGGGGGGGGGAPRGGGGGGGGGGGKPRP
jgi:hypothetical protein